MGSLLPWPLLQLEQGSATSTAGCSRGSAGTPGPGWGHVGHVLAQQLPPCARAGWTRSELTAGAEGAWLSCPGAWGWQLCGHSCAPCWVSRAGSSLVQGGGGDPALSQRLEPLVPRGSSLSSPFPECWGSGGLCRGLPAVPGGIGSWAGGCRRCRGAGGNARARAVGADVPAAGMPLPKGSGRSCRWMGPLHAV